MQDFEKELEENLQILENLKKEGVKIIEPQIEDNGEKRIYKCDSKKGLVGRIKNIGLNNLINKDKIIEFLLTADNDLEDEEDEYSVTAKQDYDSMFEGMNREAKAKFNEQNFLVNMPTSTLPVIKEDNDLLFNMENEKTRKLEKRGSFATSIIILITTLSLGVIAALLLIK